ncbi:hypothetical protein ACFWBX_27240 [Streptomyces sp. NPDC059991]|uniref:AMIN-like domain-containing (lipo)protein n=1 Tax=Streptomyces sp. NPDC059991 TaxID=3347028 RepID=UPI0036D0D6FD
MLHIRIAQRAAAAVAVLAAAVLAGTAQAQASTEPAASSCQYSCVLDARTGSHPDYDRLVFDLSNTGQLPTVRARDSSDGTYTPGASDEPRKLQIAGKSYLFLDIDPVTTTTTGPDAYTSPTVQPVSLLSLKGIQLASAGGFEMEHTTTFGLSLGNYSSYKVFTLTAPNRVVVDIYH